MNVHLIDGTYELFRHFFAVPAAADITGQEIGAVRGVLHSVLSMIERGATHIGVATDHVVESFRNELYPGYKTSAGVEEELLAQFPLAEQAVAALGIPVWPMVEFEADDALASAAGRFRDAPEVDQILLCSPDKDLAQCVAGPVVCWDRRRDIVYDEEGVLQKYGVRPPSIPDYLALVGDAADGYPGIQGWGPKSTSAVLVRYEHLESIPQDYREWGLPAARALRLSDSLRSHWQDAQLYRRLATLRMDVPIPERLPDLEWRGAREELKGLCDEWGDPKLPGRIVRWR